MALSKSLGDKQKRLARGRGIRGYWLNGVMGLLLLTALAWTGLFFQSRSATGHQRMVQTRSEAQALAASVDAIIGQRRRLIEGLARQPGLVALFEQEDSQTLQAEQERLTQLVPDALQVRLLPLGFSEPDTRLTPNMGYASLLMLRRAESSREALPAEVHRFGTAHQHIAVAASVLDPVRDKVVGVIHVAFSTQDLQRLVDGVDHYGGHVELQQIVPDKRPFSFAGNAAPFSGNPRPDGLLPVAGTIWQLAYWGDVGGTPDVPGMVVLFLPGVLLFLLGSLMLFMLGQQMGKALKRDQLAILTLFEALTTGRSSKSQPAQLADLQPTLDVLEHQIKEFRASQAEKQRGRPAIIESDVAGIVVDEASVPSTAMPTPVSLSEAVDISATIFRAYDIRGVVGETLTEEVVAQLGQGIGSEIFDRGFQSVLVARDVRTSSDALQNALIQGLKASGRDVIDLGLVPTPLLNYAVHELNIECGVMVTGSHNPLQYNGLKLVIGGECPSSESLQGLRRRIDARQLLQGQGSFDSREIVAEYIERVVSDVRLAQPLKVVIDCGNGAASVVAPELYRELGCEVVELYCNPDGSFPNHHPDPGDPKNMQALQKAVVEHQAALGLAFDGDGDRLGVVDSSGKLIWPDRVLMYLAMDVLTREPGGDIIYDVKCSRHLANIILSNGGRPLMWKSGHSNLKGKMKESHALLAGEFSGHIMFSERWYGFDDGLYAGARLLEILAMDYRGSAEVFAELPEGVSTPEYVLRLEEGHAQQVMSAIEQQPDLPGARLVKIDGLRAEFEQGWGLVRASNTTPALLFRFEADSEEGLARVEAIFRDLLTRVAPELKLPF